jgi:choline dehydrogenase-like flavoprotein
MTNPNYDVLIVGSGPAGVSAAFPIIRAGYKVLMVDGGSHAKEEPPKIDFLNWRENESNQNHRMIGRDFHALKMYQANSPKLRVPSLSYVFKDFKEKNKINTSNFMAIGSLAVGGLSNAWGCGVSRFNHNELKLFPFQTEEIRQSYKEVSERIGLSGKNLDDLSDYLGVDEYADDPIDLDKIHQYFFRNYENNKYNLKKNGFIMGRTRLAVLSKDSGARKACSLSGNCLWGCHKNSLYSSTYELGLLKKFPNFNYKSGFIVSNLNTKEEYSEVEGYDLFNREIMKISSKKIVLAAGTLASTRIVFNALDNFEERQLLSCPTAGFMICAPKFLGNSSVSSFGLGQLSFKLNFNDNFSAFGSTLATVGIPVSEFMRHMPFSSRYAVNVLKNLLSSCVVGNVFLPPEFGPAYVKLNKNRELLVSSTPKIDISKTMTKIETQLRNTYFKIGGILLPGSFTIGHRGGDIHYSGTMSMRKNPQKGETDKNGEVKGLKNIHVVDGASLPFISEKPHTLTIMANADRIGKIITNIL